MNESTSELNQTTPTSVSEAESQIASDNVGEYDWYKSYPGEDDFEESDLAVEEKKTCAMEGDFLPYATRLYYEGNSVMRIADIGLTRRLLLLGVVGSFTPYCWNRHLFKVINKARYYKERDIDYICCIATNDSYTHTTWGSYLGCADSMFMLSDTTNRFTKGLGVDIVVPWLDNQIRSKRYIIFAENMEITKLVVSENDGPNAKWKCEHLKEEIQIDEDDDDEEFENSKFWT